MRAVKFSVMEPGKCPVAVNCWVLLAGTEGSWGVTEMEIRLASVPIPVRLTFCGEVLALSTTVSVPLHAPSCTGINVTLMLHLPPGATLLGQLEAAAKPLLALMLVIVREVV